jgi:hypothetical protein
MTHEISTTPNAATSGRSPLAIPGHGCVQAVSAIDVPERLPSS